MRTRSRTMHARGHRSASWLTLHAFLTASCLLAVYPFVVMLSGSLKTPGEITSNPAGLPLDPVVDNYVDLLTGPSGAVVWRGLLNSVIVTVPYTALTVFISAMAGYAFARYQFRGRNTIFALLIASMLVPVEVNIPTMYVMFAQIDWINTYQVQIIPGTASVISMFMARQYMSSLPEEVFEAARLDGAGSWRSFWQIAVPMSTPVLGAIAVLTFVAKWSDYLWPRVMVNDPDFQPFMVLLPGLSAGQSGFILQQEVLLAGAVLVVVPLIAVFLRYQDKLMAGVTGGAVRG